MSTSPTSFPRGDLPVLPLGKLVGVFSLGLLWLTALLVLTRRLSGALDQPLPLWAWWILAVVLLWLLLGGQLATGKGTFRGNWLLGLEVLAAVTLCGSLWLPGTSLAGPATTLLAVAAASATLLSPWNHGRRGTAVEEPLPSQPERPLITLHRPGNESFEEEGEIEEDEEALSPATLQRLVRMTATDEHGELVAGSLRVPLEPGQRVAAAHVAFCPPLSTVPTIEVFQLEGPHADVQVGETQSYGARFDLRIDAELSEPVSVVLEFTAEVTKGNAPG